MSLWSSFGQTFFISLFSAEIRSSLSLTHGEFGGYYAIATTASALTLFWLGKLADTVSVLRLSLMTLGGVCLAAIHFSTVGSILALIFGIYLLRLSGQGMMHHVYTTAVTRRYQATRGRALALSGFGINLGEALFPILVILALTIFNDWRLIWILLPLFALVSFAPFIPYLTRRTAFQDGPGRSQIDKSPPLPAKDQDMSQDGDQVKSQNENHDQFQDRNQGKSRDGNQDQSLDRDQNRGLEGDENSADSPSLRRGEVIKDRGFWLVIIWLIMIPGFIITGLFFHQIHIASEKGISLWLWSSNYAWYALAAIAGALISGILVDKVSAHKIATLTQMPVILACLCLWWGAGPVWIAVFFILLGLGSGMMQPMISTLLAERYGIGWLGEIKALTSPLMVFSSALSPVVMGVLFDQGFSLDVIFGLLIALGSISLLASFIWFNCMGMTKISPIILESLFKRS